MIQLEQGGVLGCVGTDYQSNAINIATLGIPGYSVHHLAIVAEAKGRNLVFESTKSHRPPCAIRGRQTTGVQAHYVDDFLAIPFYKHIWYYPPRRSLYFHESTRLSRFLRGYLGRPYDMRGASQSAGLLYSLASRLIRGEDTTELFCSELVIAALVDIGVMRTADVSWWNPNRAVRYLIRAGICGKPQRIK